MSRDTDMSKTEETRKVIEGMVDGLNDHRIADIGEFFSDGFRWMGNAGCGTKNNLKEFQDNWQKPFQVSMLCVNYNPMDDTLQYIHICKVVGCHKKNQSWNFGSPVHRLV